MAKKYARLGMDWYRIRVKKTLIQRICLNIFYLSKNTENCQLAQIRNEREKKHDRQNHCQPFFLCDSVKDCRQVLRDEDEVGAAESDVRDEDGSVDDVTAEVAEREEGDVAVADARRC